MKWSLTPVTEGQRKYMYAWAVLLVCFAALLFDKLEDSYFAEILIWVGGFYMAGNGAEHFAKAWGNRTKPGS